MSKQKEIERLCKNRIALWERKCDRSPSDVAQEWPKWLWKVTYWHFVLREYANVRDTLARIEEDKLDKRYVVTYKSLLNTFNAYKDKKIEKMLNRVQLAIIDDPSITKTDEFQTLLEKIFGAKDRDTAGEVVYTYIKGKADVDDSQLRIIVKWLCAYPDELLKAIKTKKGQITNEKELQIDEKS